MSKLCNGLAVLDLSKPTGGLVVSKPNRLETKVIQTKKCAGKPKGHVLIELDIYYQQKAAPG
jgi:hypothetical protein